MNGAIAWLLDWRDPWHWLAAGSSALLSLRRRPFRPREAAERRPWWGRRTWRWLMQVTTANVRLAQSEEVERATRITLATTTADYALCRAENDRLRAEIARLKAERDGSPGSSGGSPSGRTAAPGAKARTRRSRASSTRLSASAAPPSTRPAISSLTG